MNTNRMEEQDLESDLLKSRGVIRIMPRIELWKAPTYLAYRGCKLLINYHIIIRASPK